MRDGTTHTAIDATDLQAVPAAVPATYEAIYEAEDYMAIIDAAYGPENVQPAVH